MSLAWEGEPKCTVIDAEPSSLASTSASTAKDATATIATAGTLTQSAYLELREKLLQSAPQKKASGYSLSEEEKEQKKARVIEVMRKKRITRKESAAALGVYKPWSLE